MATPLLQTKLYIPPARAEWIPRPALIERLRAGLDRRLTLVSAPAGFGKTTLLSQCVAECVQAEPGMRVAWLSLDQDDNAAPHFWTYLIAALQVAQQDLERDSLQLLQAPQMPPVQSILIPVLNDLAALTQRANVCCVWCRQRQAHTFSDTRHWFNHLTWPAQSSACVSESSRSNAATSPDNDQLVCAARMIPPC